MGPDAETVVARARALVGGRFRSQGRDAVRGVDCVGLVAAALGKRPERDDYALRGNRIERVEQGLHAVGLRPADRVTAGDVLVMRSGAEQLHLGLWTGDGLVHADARLRRVVERPGDPPWPIISVWRAED